MTRGTRGGVRAVVARWRGRDIELKTPGEIDAMRVAGALVARALAAVTTAARPGVSTGELDGMIAFTGHRLDAVVVLTVDPEELVQRLLQRAQTDGRADDTEDVIRRRQEVYAEQTEPLIGVYRERGILVEVDGMGEVDDVTTRIFDALDVVPQS